MQGPEPRRHARRGFQWVRALRSAFLAVSSHKSQGARNPAAFTPVGWRNFPLLSAGTRPEFRAFAMIDSAVLYISIGSLLVAIGSLVVSIAARQEARQHTIFTPRTQALDHLRIAVNDIKRIHRVTPSAVLIMRDAKSRADLAFDEKVRSDLDRVIQIADRLQFQLLSQNESDVDALLRDLDQITQRMSETAALQ
jgi:hypothetical protein